MIVRVQSPFLKNAKVIDADMRMESALPCIDWSTHGSNSEMSNPICRPASYPSDCSPGPRSPLQSGSGCTRPAVESAASRAGHIGTSLFRRNGSTARNGHDRAYGLDSTKLRSLGWNPPVDLDESFRRCVLWEKARYEERKR